MKSSDRGKIEIFDSRRGESLDLRAEPNAPELPSARLGMTVLRTESVDWMSLGTELDPLIPPSDTRFAVFRPWAPHVERKTDLFARVWHYGEVVNLAPVQVGLTARSNSSMGDLFSVRSSVGEAPAGVWLFGASPLSVDVLKARIAQCNVHADPMIFVAASLADALDLGLALDESEESTLFIRTDRTDSAVLEKFLKRAAHRFEDSK